MGDRYIIEVTCFKCGNVDDDVGYAPTCGINTWRCPKCKSVTDLEKWTGITEEEASNRTEIEEIVKEARKEIKRME